MTAGARESVDVQTPVAGLHRTVRQTVHRVTTSTAAVANNPTSSELWALVDEVRRSGRGSFLIAERRAGQPGEAYLQAVVQGDQWLLELRDGGPHRHFRVSVTDVEQVHVTFERWLAGRTVRSHLPWQRAVREVRWSA